MKWQIIPAREFPSYCSVWNQLNIAGPNSPLLHSDFIEPLLKEFSHGFERLAIYGHDDAPESMTILSRQKPGVWQTFQPSQLPVGPWLNVSPITLTELFQKLVKALPGIVFNLGISQQDPDFYPRPSENDLLSTLNYVATARLKVEGSFQDYWSSRGKNLRQNLNRQRNRLQREEVKSRLETIIAPEDMAAAVRDYGQLESTGWKNQEGTAIHPDNTQGHFYTSILENFSRRNQSKVYRYWYDDKLVASDLCIQQDDTLVILKTTYDEKITTSSPAMLMRQAYFEQIFNEGLIKNIEFYGRVMEWHKRLTDNIRMLYHVNYRPYLILDKIHRLLQTF